MKLLSEQQSAIECINNLQSIQKNPKFPINFSQDIISLYISIKYQKFIGIKNPPSISFNNSDDFGIGKVLSCYSSNPKIIERIVRYYINGSIDQIAKIDLKYYNEKVFSLNINTEYSLNLEDFKFKKTFKFFSNDFKTVINFLIQEQNNKFNIL